MSTSLFSPSTAQRSRTPQLLGSGIASTLALFVLLSGCGTLPDPVTGDGGTAPTPEAAAEEADADDDAIETTAPEAAAAEAEPAETTTTAPEPAPTADPELEPEPKPVSAEPQSFSGTGSEVVILEPLGEEVFFATVTHSGSSNIALWSVDENGQDIDLLVNDIGDYAGQVAFNFREDPAAIRVEADGAWTIDLVHLSEAPRWDGVAPYEATGDSLVIVDGVAEGLTPVNLTHDGESNFAIWAWGESYPDLIVNDIGVYEGTTLLPDGSLVLQVNADGNWTISTN